MTIEWDGIDDLIRYLTVTEATLDSDVAGVMFEEGEAIMTDAKKDTPVDTGRLRSSGHVQSPVIQRDSVEVTLAYGTDYAVYVHEIRDNVHPVGKSKFLEDQVKAHARRFGEVLKSRLERRLKRR